MRGKRKKKIYHRGHRGRSTEDTEKLGVRLVKRGCGIGRRLLCGCGLRVPGGWTGRTPCGEMRRLGILWLAEEGAVGVSRFAERGER